MQSQFEEESRIHFVIPRTNYHFKMCLSLASLGMSSIIKEDVRVLELWIDGHQEKYRLEAKNKKLKEDFAAELKKGILKAKENPSSSRVARQPQAVQVTDGDVIYYGVDICSTFRRKISHQTLTLSQGRKDRDQVLTDPSHWIIKSSANYPDRNLLKQMAGMAGGRGGQDTMATATASLSGQLRLQIFASFSFAIRFVVNFYFSEAAVKLN